MRIQPLAFGVLASLIVCALLGSVALDRLSRPKFQRLPLEFRLFEPRLSDLPVVFSDVQSCSCWGGPRDQAERKYKFHIANHTNSIIDVGAGERSAIRLLVAYPTRNGIPKLTIPVGQRSDKRVQAGSPPDKLTEVATKFRAVRPSKVDGAKAIFAVPASYTIWAIPSNPNGIAEGKNDGTLTYPTVIDQEFLLPEESYRKTRLGHETWTFYVPLDHDFATKFASSYDSILPRALYEPHVIFVGVAALRLDAKHRVRIIGFAPAPSDNAFGDPGSL